MVAPVVQQDGVTAGSLGMRREDLTHLRDGPVRIHLARRMRMPDLVHAEAAGVAVAADLVDGQDLAPVGRAPRELPTKAIDLVAIAPRVDERIDPHATQKLRNLRHVAERVGHVAHLLNAAQLARGLVSQDEVPHGGFTADEEFVWKDVPGPYRETASADEVPDAIPFLGTHRQVIIEQNRLAVQHEVIESPRLQIGEYRAKGPVHVHPEFAERLVPLPVPVSMRDDEGHSRRRVVHSSSRAARRPSMVPVAMQTEVSAAP